MTAGLPDRHRSSPSPPEAMHCWCTRPLLPAMRRWIRRPPSQHGHRHRRRFGSAPDGAGHTGGGPAADLTVSKAICPATVTESGQLTYTFVLQNFGNTAATAGDNVILTDTFDPALTGLTVTYNGDADGRRQHSTMLPPAPLPPLPGRSPSRRPPIPRRRMAPIPSPPAPPQ